MENEFDSPKDGARTNEQNELFCGKPDKVMRHELNVI